MADAWNVAVFHGGEQVVEGGTVGSVGDEQVGVFAGGDDSRV